MKILVACEESQRVCLAFREKGFEAYSCDIVFCSGGHPEFHIWADVLPLLNGKCHFRTCDGQLHFIDKWDMIIAFPPCTFLSKAGSANLYKNGVLDIDRFNKGQEAVKFFMSIYNADCDKIAIENLVPMKIFDLPNFNQVIEPYYFGVPVSKKTYLWLKGLPYLTPTNVVEPKYTFETFPLFKNSHGKYRQKNRAKTFSEVASAMALSWGLDLALIPGSTSGVNIPGSNNVVEVPGDKSMSNNVVK